MLCTICFTKTFRELPDHQTKVTEKWQQAKSPALLEPPKQSLVKDDYKEKLNKLTKVADALRYNERKVIVAFEGNGCGG